MVHVLIAGDGVDELGGVGVGLRRVGTCHEVEANAVRVHASGAVGLGVRVESTR